MADYTVSLHPPKYPERMFPGRCTHEPQFVMQARVTIDKAGTKRAGIVTEHAMCLACGSPRPCSYGGNVFVDLHELWAELGWHAEIGARLLAVREKWARIATYLFGPDGWNGRHERIARLIDPKLSMRLVVQDTGRRSESGRRIQIGQVTGFDPSYLREAA